MGPSHGLSQLYFKLESSNPTGSFKDRFACAAISSMLAQKKTRCVATSSGNTGSALAAYCAAASIRCHIAIVETAPVAKLRQMMAYGAKIFKIRDFGLNAELTEQTFAQLEDLGRQPDSALQISSYTHSAAGMRGVESVSYELAEQADGKIDHVFCPAGGGGLCVAVARGFAGLVSRDEGSPAVHCVQPEGNDTISSALRNRSEPQDVRSSTQISGLQVASVVDGDLVLEYCGKTGGTGHLVTDEQAWQTQRELAREEGVFCEPAGAVALAGALSAATEKIIDPDSRIVCLVTGIGFKDDHSLIRMVDSAACPLIDLDEMKHHIQRADP